MPRNDELEIMFEDLNEDSQKKVLQFYGLKDAKNANFDIVPLFVLNKQSINKICMNCKHAIVNSSDEGTQNYVCDYVENVVDAEDSCNKFEVGE